MRKTIALSATLACLCATPLASAAADIKIGFVTTLTTGGAVIGNDMRDAVNLAVDQLGSEMGGKTFEILFEDDGFKPEIGKQVTEKLIKEDNVDLIAGYIWSNVLMASYKSATRADKILISTNAGPSAIAGKQCNKNFFSTSWQNNQTPMAMGELLNAHAQLDFSAELAKAKASNADGLVVFYPGKAGGAFVQQYQQAGLSEVLPLYTIFTIDSLSLPKLQEANMDGIVGSEMSAFWAPDLDNETNKQFVAAFKEKYGRYPSHYAAQSYDAINLIASAASQLDGDFSDTDKVRAELVKADFNSVRGDFEYGNNHMPIQNFYARQVVADEDGNWTTSITKTVLEAHQDVFAADCKL